jgi:hypothetical protein
MERKLRMGRTTPEAIQTQWQNIAEDINGSITKIFQRYYFDKSDIKITSGNRNQGTRQN